MEKIKTLRDKISPKTILIGNGDVENLEDARKKIKKYGIDGVMIGRGIFKNP
jgi:tRNA-dihydrouridine synthase